MKEIRLKATRYIFKQCQKSETVGSQETFEYNIVDTTDIDDNRKYYGGFLFVPSVASHLCTHGGKTASADAAHCQRVGPQSYETSLEVVCYDFNNHVVPICFYHSVGTESTDTRKNVFEAVKDISDFYVPGRVTIVDQEKSIDSSFGR